MRILMMISALMTGAMSYAITPAEVRFHNEGSDTTKITQVLMELDKIKVPDGQTLVAAAGEFFMDAPYVSGTLEGKPEQLTVNTEELDCTTFVETALALAMTINDHRSSWRDYISNLESIRYRGGHVDGYPSRLHYVSDWIVDNTHRGNLKEVTDRVGRADSQIKTLDYMSQHRDAYPALADSAAYEGIKRSEMGYRSHKFSYIKAANVGGAALREGDVVALVTNTKGLDVSHLGIIKMIDGVAHLMHASSKLKKVAIDPLPLTDYMRRNRTPGLRIIRLAN